jgi:serine/threonine protein kinase
VQSYGWFETPEAIYITMEYLEHGDLLQHLVRPLPEEEARTLGSQVLEGLKFMHDNGFVHRDLKPQNILVVSPGPAWRVQISDFGISRRLEEGTTVTMRQGTLGFMAPELQGFIRAGSSPYAVDMWSLGALLFFVLTKAIFMKDLHRLRDFSNGAFAAADAETRVLRELGVSEQCSEFLRCLLAPSPDDRPSSEAASGNSWLAVSSADIHRGISSHGAEESARTAVLDTVLATESSAQASAAWSSTVESARTAILETVSAPEPSTQASAASSSTVTAAGPQLRLASASSPESSIADPVIFWEAKPEPNASRLLASASEDRTVKVWDLETGQCRETLDAYAKPSAGVHAVSVTFFRSDMLMWASDKGVRLWDLKRGASEQWLGSFTKSRLSPIFADHSQKLAHLRKKTLWARLRL